MSFISKIIPSRKVIIIDVGTYKLRVAVCEYKNNEIKILSYSEKKQENTDVLGNEITNIEGITNTIGKTLKRVFKNKNINTSDLVINIPTSAMISSGRIINYTRDTPNEKIDIKELDYIIGKVENEALEDAKKQIYKKTGYSEVDMKLITSSITNINIDELKVTNPIGFTGKNISLSTLNIFVPASRYDTITTISSYIGKNILSIIPLEFSITKILDKTDYTYDDVVFIDVGNTKTSIIVQKAGVIIGFNRINLGIYDLIKSIKENTGETNMQIIKNLTNEKKYLKEKEEFLSVWEEGFIISLKDLLNSSLVPYKIFIFGGGDSNFLREHILNIDLQKYSLHSLKTFNFLEIDLKKKILINNDKQNIFNKTNIGLLSMILATKEIIQYKNNPVISIIKNFLDKNEF